MSELAGRFPRHMYNGKFRKPAGHNGDLEPVYLVVNNEEQEKAAAANGWTNKIPARPAAHEGQPIAATDNVRTAPAREPIAATDNIRRPEHDPEE